MGQQNLAQSTSTTFNLQLGSKREHSSALSEYSFFNYCV